MDEPEGGPRVPLRRHQSTAQAGERKPPTHLLEEVRFRGAVVVQVELHFAQALVRKLPELPEIRQRLGSAGLAEVPEP